MFAVEMRLDAQRGPVVEFLQQGLAHAARLQSQRIAAEVRLLAVAVARDQELVAEPAQLVFGIQLLGGDRMQLAHSNLERGRPSHSSAVPW